MKATILILVILCVSNISSQTAEQFSKKGDKNNAEGNYIKAI